jgi:hypothetical protein
MRFTAVPFMGRTKDDVWKALATFFKKVSDLFQCLSRSQDANAAHPSLFAFFPVAKANWNEKDIAYLGYLWGFIAVCFFPHLLFPHLLHCRLLLCRLLQQTV